jgi:hypothetical protein
MQHVSGYFWDTNEERRFVVAGGALNAYKLVGGVPDTSLTVEAIYIDKIIGVHITEGVFDIAGYSFQVSTATRILHLLAHTQEERTKWLKVLGKPGSGGSGGSTFVSRSTFISNAARGTYNPGATLNSPPTTPTPERVSFPYTCSLITLKNEDTQFLEFAGGKRRATSTTTTRRRSE